MSVQLGRVASGRYIQLDIQATSAPPLSCETDHYKEHVES
jgi:hypothetical protein